MIVKMLFGSHLYGTATPDSDTDFKGVAFPTWKQVALGKIPKHIEKFSTGSKNTKNTSTDVDIEIFSLHEFVKLALEGQMIALDMLHAPFDRILETSSTWEDIIQHRDKFYSTQIRSFLSYAIGQAAKYGIKGSRLNAAQQFEAHLRNFASLERLGNCRDTLMNSEFIQWNSDHVEVCGKKLQYSNRVEYSKELIQKFIQSYGERAKLAANNEGIDWKAISHAFRSAYQMRQLFSEGTITFPRPEASFLLNIKLGNYAYLDLSLKLEELIENVKELCEKSKLPKKPDHTFWENFLISKVEELQQKHEVSYAWKCL